MEINNHCVICENQLFNIKTGTKCKLTSQKPDFNERCPNIRLKNKSEERIKEINIEYERIRRIKASSIANSLLYLISGLIIMIAAYLIGALALDGGVISTVPLIIIAVGFLLLVRAVGPYNYYRQHMAVAKKNKEQLDAVLLIYNVEYDIKIDFKTDFLGNKEASTELRYL